MNIDFLKLIELAGNLSSFSLLVLAIVGGFKGWYVWRWSYDQTVTSLAKERDEWKAIALQGLKLTNAVIQTGAQQQSSTQ